MGNRLFGIINSGSLFGSGIAGFLCIPFMKSAKLTKQYILYSVAASLIFSAGTWSVTKMLFASRGMYFVSRQKKYLHRENTSGLDDASSTSVPWSRKYYAFTCVLEIFANLCRMLLDLLMAIRLGDMDTGSRAILLGQVSGLQSLMMVPFMLSAPL